MKTPASYESAVQESIRYLGSDEAMQSLDKDTYWPKWNSPWWHVTLLNEMGLAEQIPERAILKFIERLDASPLKIFPVHAHEIPEGVDLFRGTHCHCSLGNIYQALAAWGVDVDQKLPWIKEWFLRYQLPDGGLNCDNDAYLKESPASSMVGTIAPLEAVLYFTHKEFTVEEIRFLDRGAQCLIERQLMHATTNPNNQSEREDEEDWLKLCFPRFYLYDVLRGLTFILSWSDICEKELSRSAIDPVVRHLESHFSKNRLRIGRQSYGGISTIVPEGASGRREPASLFPLLEGVSRIGDPSPFLSAEWESAKTVIESLEARGLLK
jgi:hypothetical protein